MSNAQIEKYFQTAKFSISKIIKEVPSASICLMLLFFLLENVPYLIYPEVGVENMKPFSLICIYNTSILALLFMSSSLACVFDQISISKRLPFKIRARLAVVEFYIPSVGLSLLYGLRIFYFSTIHQRIIVAMTLIGVIALFYYFSWSIRYKISSKKFISLPKGKFKKKYRLSDYLAEIIPIAMYAISMSFVLLKFLYSKTWIINDYAPTAQGYFIFASAILCIYIPSLAAYILRCLKGFILGFFLTCGIIIVIVPKALSLNNHWLSTHHIANFDDRQYLIKKFGCDALKTSGVPIEQQENGTCKISIPFEVINETPAWYNIKLKTAQLNKQIFYIRKKDIFFIKENHYQTPIVKFVDRDTDFFSKLYHQKMLVVIDKDGEEPIVSEHGFSKNFNFLIADKGLVLGSYLQNLHHLITLEDDASFLNQKYSGTILNALLADTNNKFYHSLIVRFKEIFQRSNSNVHRIEDIVQYFLRLAKENNYREIFSKLGYWTLGVFDGEQVIELLHKEDQAELLLLYFTQQEFAIAIALENPNFTLTLNDKRIKNYLHAIMQDNEVI